MNKQQIDAKLPSRWRYRFGTRFVLAVMLILAILFSWFGRESFRVSRQSQIVHELFEDDVRVRERRPTGMAMLASKMLRHENQQRFRNLMDENWFAQPQVLVTWTMTDDQVAEIAAKTRVLGTVSELHVEESPLTHRGLSDLRAALPQVAVLTRAQLVGRPAPEAQFAWPALRLLGFVSAGIVGAVIIFLLPFRRPRVDSP